LLKHAGCNLFGWCLEKPACTRQYQASTIKCQMMLPGVDSVLRIQSKHALKAVEL
jgi:hypothetical protein